MKFFSLSIFDLKCNGIYFSHHCILDYVLMIDTKNTIKILMVSPSQKIFDSFLRKVHKSIRWLIFFDASPQRVTFFSSPVIDDCSSTERMRKKILFLQGYRLQWCFYWEYIDFSRVIARYTCTYRHLKSSSLNNVKPLVVMLHKTFV